MDKTFTFWLTCFILGMIGWVYVDLDNGNNTYEEFEKIYNKTSGKKMIILKDILRVHEVIDDPDHYVNETTSDERLYEIFRVSNLMQPYPTDLYYSDPQDQAVSGWPMANQTICGQQLQWLTGILLKNPNYTHLKGQLGREITNLMDTYGKPIAGMYNQAANTWLGSYESCMKIQLNYGQINNRFCFAKFKPKSWPSSGIEHPESTIRIGICIPESCDTNSFDLYKTNLEFLAMYELPNHYKDSLVFHSMVCLPDERSPIRQIPLIGRLTIAMTVFWFSMIIIVSIVYEYIYRKKYRRPKHYNIDSVDSHELSFSESSSDDNNNNENKLDEKEIDAGDENPHNVNLTNNKLKSVQLNQFEIPMPTEPPQQPFWIHVLEGLTIRYSFKQFKSCTFRIRYNRGERTRVDLSSFDFYKSMFAVAIVMAHGHVFASMLARTYRGRIDLTNNHTTRVIISVGRFVDTFFLFFGVLTSYGLLRKLNLRQLSNPFVWILANVGIYLRIMPVFMLTYLFNRSVVPYLGSGPWWDYGIDHHSANGNCQSQQWFKILPVIGNFGQPSVPTCNPPSWFLVSYAQISLIIPLMTYIIYRLTRFTYRIGLVILIGCASGFHIAHRLYVQEVVPTDAFARYGGQMVLVVDKYESSGYLDTLGRIGSVAVGCLVGYLLHLYRIERISKWPNWLRSNTIITITVIAHILILAMPTIGHRIYIHTHKIITREEFVTANAILFIIWPFLNAVLVLNMTTVSAKHVLIRFMSNPFWHVFNKLGLSILLVQYSIIVHGLTVFDDAPTNGFIMDSVKIGTYGLILSIIVALIMYIFVEAPITHLTMLVFKPFMKPRPQTSQEDSIDKQLSQVDSK